VNSNPSNLIIFIFSRASSVYIFLLFEADWYEMSALAWFILTKIIAIWIVIKKLNKTKLAKNPAIYKITNVANTIYTIPPASWTKFLRFFSNNCSSWLTKSWLKRSFWCFYDFNILLWMFEISKWAAVRARFWRVKFSEFVAIQFIIIKLNR